MKVFFLILVALVLLVGFGYRNFNLTLAHMQACIDIATQKVMQDVNTLVPNQTDQATLCQHSFEQYQDLKACYCAVTKHYYFPTQWVEFIMVRSIPNFPVLENNKNFYNRACPGQPIT